jgi:hypothetical protein
MRKTVAPMNKETELEGLEGTKSLSVLSNNTHSLKTNDTA